MNEHEILIACVTIPSHKHFPKELAQLILHENEHLLPDLSSVVIFIPNALAAQQIKEQISLQSKTAILGPHISSMQQWINNFIQVDDENKIIISQQTKKLLLLEAIKQNPGLFSEENSWQVCDSLLTLFEELTVFNEHSLETTEDKWTEQLEKCYQSDSSKLKYLGHEAKIVYRLWHAWQQQTKALNILDSETAYNIRLHNKLNVTENTCFYVIGKDELTPSELTWCENTSRSHKLNYISLSFEKHPENTSNDKYTFFDNAYNDETPLFDRKNAIKKELKLNKLNTYGASSPEQEAKAIDLKTRIWLLDGINNIGIVTEDRKLARRVRALLERSSIFIQDTAGWSLATTSAATIIERWLECIEEDFDHQPFLDLLKSPFFSSLEQRENHLSLVHRLEQDIILHENIARDLNRYRLALIHRKNKLHNWPTDTFDHLKDLLDKISDASSELKSLYSKNTQSSPQIFIDTFISSLKKLNIYQQLETDMAGARIIRVLNLMIEALKHSSPKMGWNDFRYWINYNLEQEEFTPQNLPSAVKLMNLKQAQYCHFDALIIAGANKDTLPGTSNQSPFFNQNVRQSLALPSWPDVKQQYFKYFRYLLGASNHLLLTHCNEINGEWQQPSPWLKSITDFAKIALDIDLQDKILCDFLKHDEINVLECNIDSTPEQTQQPKPGINQLMIPTEFSASRHQRLINCPYLFFASDALSLKASEKITEELLKSEYGEKVHLILQAFHQQVPGLPEPFQEKLTTNNKQKAFDHIEHLSKQVFEKNIEDSIQHRDWLQRWLNTADAYLDWQIERQQDWDIFTLESKHHLKITQNLSIKGRLDRIDAKEKQYSIIDYKTGIAPRQKDIDAGEDIQLTSYANLIEHVNEVSYCELSANKVKITSHLEEENLNTLKKLTQERLISLTNKIHNHHELPAWGDEKTCQYCDMDGLCRKQIWETQPL